MGAIFFIVLEGNALKQVLAFYILVMFLVYSYLDKILLILLNAREVIGTDKHQLFQSIKNESYKTFKKEPQIYLYSGNKLNCFVLESRSEWVIVLERRILNQLNSQQVRSLVNYLYRFKGNGLGWYQTKAMGICALIYSLNFWIIQKVAFLNPKGTAYRILSIFSLMMVSPALVLLDYFAKKESEIISDQSLKAIVFQIEKKTFTVGEFLLGHLLPNFDSQKLLIDYLESFPVLENCRFCADDVK